MLTFSFSELEPLLSLVALFVSLVAWITTIRNKTIHHEKRLDGLESNYKEFNNTKKLLHELNGKMTVILEIVDISSKKR